MLYFVHSFFKPLTEELAAIRERETAAHRAFVDQFKDNILVRGPTLDEKGERIANVMIAEFSDRAAVDRFLAEEPMTKAGVMERIVIQEFSKSYPKA